MPRLAEHRPPAPKPRQLRAYCRTRIGGAIEIRVLDVSIAGCVFDKRSSVLSVNQRVLMKLPGLAYLAANVVWIDEGLVAVAFEQPLYEPVLKHMMRYHSTARA